MADIPGLPPRAPAGRRLHNGPIPMTVPEVNASLMHALMITAHAFMIVTVEGPVFHMCICNVTTAPCTALMIALCARGGKVLWKNGRSSLRYPHVPNLTLYPHQLCKIVATFLHHFDSKATSVPQPRHMQTCLQNSHKIATKNRQMSTLMWADTPILHCKN